MKALPSFRENTLAILIAGDVVAFLGWVVAGLSSHRMGTNIVANLARVVAPFLIGWFVVAPFTGAYRRDLLRNPRAFLGRSALAWLLGVGLGLALRARPFGSGFVPAFAAVTYAVTGVFVLGWRAAFVWLWQR
ncbi:MAG: hypothetical protein AVDCRST_MAG26-4335 [uncultured Chloroflexia bacterium]|uniref:DUF3054 domain-containing protein n=1 Tax=uncultured Chloroflexia bacterium TaxID=1672391 RepID=A0A6J4K2Q1_9CHLR|nr:MAG: hypothetical protein AVDCRST_MAG26-4335 [uncultured Chloroflexia bacterium]